MSFYTAFVEAIHAYTGLSPAAFFTIVALMVAAYHLVSAMFVSPESGARAFTPPSPPPEPVQVGELKVEELKAYDGSDPGKPLLMAIKGQIYDVTRGRMFYGPGGPYALFAGRDASRALALMSFDPNDLNGNLEGLSTAELEVLQDWEEKFKEKYTKVGQLVAERTRDMNGNQGNEHTETKVESNRNTEDADGAETDSVDPVAGGN